MRADKDNMFFDIGECDLLNDEALSPQATGAINAYNRGYNCGLTWPDAWENHGKPGGPAIWGGSACFDCRGRGCDRQTSPRYTCRQWMEYGNQSATENKLWRQGWELGHKTKLETNKHFTIEQHIALESLLNNKYRWEE